MSEILGEKGRYVVLKFEWGVRVRVVRYFRFFRILLGLVLRNVC